MSDRPACPSAETLAAFLDGRLGGRERRTVVGHLADCERCREVASETARFQSEAEGALPPSVTVFPGERRRARARLVLAAAALLVGAAWLGIRWFGPGSGTAPLPTAPVAAVKPSGPAGTPLVTPPAPVKTTADVKPAIQEPAGFYAGTLARLAKGPAGRGGEVTGSDAPFGAGNFAFAGGVSRVRAAARIGIGLVALSLARRSGAVSDAGRIRDGLESSVSALPNPGPVREALSALAAESDPSRLGACLEAVGRALGPSEEPFCRFGFWVGAGERAAAARDRSFFSPGLPDALDAGAVVPHLPPGAAKTLDALRTLLEGGFETETDWRRLEKQLRDLRGGIGV